MIDILNGTKPGRENDDQRILAYNIGISIQDVYFASKIYELIAERNKTESKKFWV